MLVKDWMSVPPVTIEADESIQRAVQLMRKHEIRMLPVLAEGDLAGVLTDRDIKRASPSSLKGLELFELLDAISETPVKQIMSPDPVTARWDSTIEEVTLELLLQKISGAPVVDDTGAVIGVITASDIFNMLIALTGFNKKGIQFAFMLVDQPGSIKSVSDLIRDHGARIASILTTRERAPRGYLKAYIRAYKLDRVTCQRLQQMLKKQTTLLYTIDHESQRRKFYDTGQPSLQEIKNEPI
jgi:acetoin utilization protein AcuB